MRESHDYRVRLKNLEVCFLLMTRLELARLLLATKSSTSNLLANQTSFKLRGSYVYLVRVNFLRAAFSQLLDRGGGSENGSKVVYLHKVSAEKGTRCSRN